MGHVEGDICRAPPPPWPDRAHLPMDYTYNSSLSPATLGGE